MSTGRDDVRGTKWFGHENSTDTTESTPDRNLARLFGHTLPNSTILANQKPRLSSCATKITLQDPWELYEARARIFLDRNIILARLRDRRFELVNIQRLTVEPAVAQSLVEVISRCPHRSFLRLHGFLKHGDCYFLVWEPAEFTLNEVLASECYITEAELAQIAWPVRTDLLVFFDGRTIAHTLQILNGIRTLRNEGRTLATLTTRDILFTEIGEVKIGALVFHPP